MPPVSGNPLLPHWRSISGRYLIVSGLLSLLLAAGAAAGWAYVRGMTNEHVAHIEWRSSAATALADTSTQLRQAEAHLQRYLISPQPQRAEAARQSLRLARSAARALAGVQWALNDGEMSHTIGALGEELDELRFLLQRVIELRADSDHWFPALEIIDLGMRPNAARFLETGQSLIEGSEARPDEALLLRELHDRAAKLFLGSRLILAAHFGTLGAEDSDDLDRQALDTQAGWLQVHSLLERLENMGATGTLHGDVAAEIPRLRKSLDDWYSAFGRLIALLRSELWRADVPVLQGELDPLLEGIYRRIAVLQLELGVGSARDITDLTEVSQALYRAVLLLALGAILLLMLGFVAFNRSITMPIERISSAMRAVARGESGIDIPRPTTDETRSLTEAFNEMCEQVSSREARLDQLAHHDSLTGLPNRALFQDRLGHALEIAARNRRGVGLMFLDLDRFKQVNDTLGHSSGDQLLLAVAQRLQGSVRAGDTIARLGGDEFAVIVEGVDGPSAVREVAEKVLRTFAEPIAFEGRELHITTSIGIALYPQDANDPEALTRYADLAMYGAKEAGRDGYQFFAKEMPARMRRHLDLEIELRHAIEHEEFRLHFQPIIATRTGAVSGCEALLRWQHPRRGLLPPAEFIPVLEETGLIVPATEWVLQAACGARAEWQAAGLQVPPISINLSPRLLQGRGFLDLMHQVLNQPCNPGESLVLEITENVLVEDLQAAARALDHVKGMGVQIMLDDFGTGQSSLNHLRRSPVDAIKIDRDFVRELPTRHTDAGLVEAMIGMAHGLELEVVAEGVETAPQLEFLRALGCEHVQGFLYSRPLPIDQFTTWLTRNGLGAATWAARA